MSKPRSVVGEIRVYTLGYSKEKQTVRLYHRVSPQGFGGTWRLGTSHSAVLAAGVSSPKKGSSSISGVYQNAKPLSATNFVIYVEHALGGCPAACPLPAQHLPNRGPQPCIAGAALQADRHQAIRLKDSLLREGIKYRRNSTAEKTPHPLK